MMIRSLVFLGLALLGGLTIPGSATAAVSCRVDSFTDMDFGRPGTPIGPVATTSQVVVSCDGNQADAGTQVLVCVGLQDAPSPREMRRNNANRLPYEIYSDPGHNRILDFRNNVFKPLTIGPNGSRVTETFILYGRLEPTGASPQSGTYTDRVRAAMGWSTASGATCDTVPVGEEFRFDSLARLAGLCTVNADDLDFGAPSSLSSDIDRSTTLQVTCTRDTLYRVRLDGGTTTGDIGNRRMRHDDGGSETVGYNLYLDPARVTLWGNGTTGGVAQGSGNDGGTMQTLTVYGRVPSQGPARTGRYTDTVTATVEY
jgi:spore coat protein U-like protein